MVQARLVLAARLRELRKAVGLTGVELAERLGPGWGQPKISKIESGRQLPSSADVEVWARATSADAMALHELLDRAHHEFRRISKSYRESGGAGSFQSTIADQEKAATRIFDYQQLIVPGLVQAPEYARALLALPGGPLSHGASSEDVDRMIAERLRRSSILYEPGREVTVLINEAALLNQVGSAEIMLLQRQQVSRLATSLNHARVGVVPLSACPVLPMNGWNQRDGVVSIETITGATKILDPDEVAQYEHWQGLLIDSAIFGAELAEFVAGLDVPD